MPPPVVLPPATIGILGGGQLGRMVGLAARSLGYRVSVLDPDPDCPARPVADEVVVAAYDDLEGARRLAASVDVVTVELEHIGPEIATALERDGRLLRPGSRAIAATQDRLAERRFLESIDAPVAPWREVRTPADLDRALGELPGGAHRLKAALGGYDGRSQVRLGPAATPGDRAAAFAALAASAAAHGLLLEREVDFVAELSVVIGRAADGTTRAYPPVANVHDDGILLETHAPAPVPPAVAAAAVELATRIAAGLDVVGVMTAELFLGRDASLAVNELAPRVHNSGHWTIEGAATSQFEQHVRAICGLPLGATDPLRPAVMTNLLGAGPRRPARLVGVGDALATPFVHLHLYGKREVFGRRKMGHVTALGESPAEALARARTALAALSWEGSNGE